MPSPEWASAHFAKAETWLGAAAVVRQDRLYLMAGLLDAAQYLAQPDNEMRVSIDCKGNQAWDVRLLLSWRQGTWAVTQLPVSAKKAREGKSLPAVQGAVGTAAEVSLAIRDFVPVSEAKPLWTIVMEAHSEAKNVKGELRWLPTPDIPVFNENAREGVAAWPYVRTFLCLCADKPLDDFELTAAAIAIMSSTMYNGSDEEVRKKIRVDNAEFLEFARSIDAWQKQADTEYRLKTYPLEAQLAWAARFAHGKSNYETGRGPKQKNNAENYYWVSTSVETLKKLKALAIKEKLADASLSKCGALIDDWVQVKQVEPYNTTTTPSRKGDFRGEAREGREVFQLKSRRHWGDLKGEAREAREKELRAIPGFGSHHAETVLKQIETYGYIIGAKCGQHNQFSQNLMRALGIAPLGFWVKNSREGIRSDHAWPAWYDPAQNVWLSYQRGRDEKNRIWYFFTCKRRPLFSYAAEAAISTTEVKKLHIGKSNTGPFPFVFCREMQGFEVPKLSHTGIPTQEIREWMLTPGF